ncbi:MAG: BlaI/MecI/CopY family transcriptional regulator [Rhodospirillaceae bacterium]
MSETNDEAKDLGDLERDVMQLIWDGGEMTAETVREKLDIQGRSLKESTVRTVLRRLEEKGFLTHETEARTFIYRAAEARGKVAAKAVKRIVDWFCNGSMEEVLVGLVDSKMLDQKQLQDLAKKIEKARAGKGDAKATGGKK